MIVELVEINKSYYIKQEDGSNYFVCSVESAANFIQVGVIPFDEQTVMDVPRPTMMLKPEEIVELSKSGIRADEIIRLRQAGVL